MNSNPDKQSAISENKFPIIAIGGSAASLELLLNILEPLPTNAGIAFVFVQDQKDEVPKNLAEKISGKLNIPVLDVEDKIPVEPEFFYFIPAHKNMTLENGVLNEIVNPEQANDQMPVNRLFTTLAENYREYAIGILLSAQNSDGVQGLKAIKSRGGLTFAQKEISFFQGLTTHVVEEGAVDLVLSPNEIAEELNSLLKQKGKYYQYLQDMNGTNISDKDEHLQMIISLVQRAVGIDFGQYKINTVKRRIIRRTVLHRLNTLKEYVEHIKEHHNEAQLLFQDLLINVTSFFRDPELNEYLKENFLPNLIKNKKHNEPIRIWVPACSTGQEVYSMAILLLEVLGEEFTQLPINIFATDLSESAINKARLGVYSKMEVEGVSAQRLKRFFTKVDGGYRIIKSIRDICVFATHNIAKDPPFTRLDIISCCNLLIYIDIPLQKKIISTFHYALNNQGILILGKSETVGNMAHLFTQEEKKIKIYTKKKDTLIKTPFDLNYHLPGTAKLPGVIQQVALQKAKDDEADLEEAVDKLLLKQFTPASVVIDRDMDIVQFRGSTGMFLEPTPGKASLNLLKMARPGLGFELRTAIHKCQKSGEVVKKSGLEITINGTVKHIDIEIMPVKTSLDAPYYLVAFEETPVLPQTNATTLRDKRVKQLEAELASMQEDMRSIIESQEATVEELQSANEEIISSNEELQSINEELETSKEEVESSNEELITINQELQLRNEQLTEVQDYAEAVFSSIRESLVILDRNLRVKKANFVFYKTYHLREEHTEGRYLYEINQKQWDIPQLKDLLENLLPQNEFVQGFEIIHNFPGIGERTLLLNVRRIRQRLHADQMILLAIEDITENRRAQKIIEDREVWFRNLADNAPIMIWVTDKDKKPTFFNKAWLEFRNATIEEALRKGWTDGVHPDDLTFILKKFNVHFAEKLPFELKYRVLHNNSEYVLLHNKAKPNFTPEGQFLGYIGSCVIISEVLESRGSGLEK